MFSTSGIQSVRLGVVLSAVLVALWFVLSYSGRSAPKDEARAVSRPSTNLMIRTISTDSWDAGYFLAKGSWVEDGKDLEKAIEFQCLKEKAICVEAIGWNDGPLFVTAVLFDVASWDANAIKISGLPDACGTVHIAVQREPATVRMTIVPHKQQPKACGPDKRPEFLHLDTGPVQ